MSGTSFADTNILMYAHDSAAGEKHDKARALVAAPWETRSGVASTQVLRELAVNWRKTTKEPPDARAMRRIASDALARQVVVNGGDAILEALDIEARHHLSFRDALVIQAPQASGAAILHSPHVSDGRQYGGVRSRNPFEGSGARPGRGDSDP